MPATHRLPPWLPFAYTLWMMLLVPFYWGYYGPQNFLWLCDAGSFLILIALWTNSSLLISSQIVGILLVDLFWIIDAAGRLITGTHIIGGTEYMFTAAIPLHIRLLSLFHIAIPVLLLFSVARLGYDRRGMLLQTAITWAILPLTYAATDPALNINWVFGPFGKVQTAISPLLYLGFMMIAYPLVLYIPAHYVILFIERRFFERQRGKGPAVP